MLVEKQLTAGLENVGDESPEGSFWTGNGAEGENGYEGINGLGYPVEGRKLVGVFGTVWEDQKGACRFGEACCVCLCADLGVHELVWLEGDVFGDFVRTEILYSMAMA